MSVDYTIFYKQRLSADDLTQEQWDLFLSTFNPSERVTAVFDRVQATRKIWVVHGEYGLGEEELPAASEVICPGTNSEAGFVGEVFSVAGISTCAGARICVDVTGFMRPHLMFLMKWLQRQGATSVDVLYSEPVSYRRREATQFSKGTIEGVRQVAGFEGVASRDASNDVLVIGAGYDDRLMAEVAEYKDKAEKVQIYGLPPLRADMYQQNLLRAERAAEAIGVSHSQIVDHITRLPTTHLLLRPY